MLRFRKLISKDTLLRLYIMPHFNYCSSVWHFCGARNEKIDTLDKRILRYVLRDYNSPYDSALSKVNSKSLYKRRLQTFLIILYRSLYFTRYTGYLRDMFSLLSTSYSLRGNYILSLPSARSTTYGLHSFVHGFKTVELSSTFV